MEEGNELRMRKPIGHLFGNDGFVWIFDLLFAATRCCGVCTALLLLLLLLLMPVETFLCDRGLNVFWFGDGIEESPIVVNLLRTLDVDFAAEPSEL